MNRETWRRMGWWLVCGNGAAAVAAVGLFHGGTWWERLVCVAAGGVAGWNAGFAVSRLRQERADHEREGVER